MIHELGAAAIPPAVHAPSGLNPRDVDVFGRAYLAYLLDRQTFAGIFDHAPLCWNILQRKHSKAMHRGAPDSHAKTREFRIDPPLRRSGRYHSPCSVTN